LQTVNNFHFLSGKRGELMSFHVSLSRHFPVWTG